MDPRDGWVVDRRGDFLGVVLPNAARRAKRRRFVRLYHRDHSHWDEATAVHEEVVCPGARHRLDGVLLHINHAPVDELLAGANRYASLEARELAAGGRRVSAAEVVLRPVARFLWHLVVVGEWRQRGHGVVHAGIKATAEFMRQAKRWELQQGSPPAADGPARGTQSRAEGWEPERTGGADARR